MAPFVRGGFIFFPDDGDLDTGNTGRPLADFNSLDLHSSELIAFNNSRSTSTQRIIRS